MHTAPVTSSLAGHSPVGAVDWTAGGERGAELWRSRVHEAALVWRPQHKHTHIVSGKKPRCRSDKTETCGCGDAQRGGKRSDVAEGKKGPLPCSPSLESESDQREKTDSDIEKEGEMCGGGGGDRKDKVECKAKDKTTARMSFSRTLEKSSTGFSATEGSRGATV